ncbi:MAG: hypothetical protein ACI9B9_000828 [Halioglobus sp.]
MKCLLAFALTAVLCGCETVQPWERGTLAREDMEWDGDIMEAAMGSQIHASKEASSGGSGAAGGGCGCN